MRRERPPRSLTAGRDLLAPAALLAALLAIVAVASRGRVGPSEATHQSPLLSGVFPYVYAALVVAGAFAIPFFFYVFTQGNAYTRAQRRRARLLPLWIGVVVVVAVVIRSQLGDSFSDILSRLSFGDADGAGTTPTRPGRPPAPELGPLALVSSVIAVGAGGFLVRRAWRRQRGRLPARVADALSATVEETLDDLRHEPDARRAIIRAYARMERALEASGVRRHEAEAPLEYLTRVLLELEVRPEPVRALTDLFEHAKFSSHDVRTPDKETAIAALEDVRADLERLP
jgi:hypothetical protein